MNDLEDLTAPQIMVIVRTLRLRLANEQVKAARAEYNRASLAYELAMINLEWVSRFQHELPRGNPMLGREIDRVLTLPRPCDMVKDQPGEANTATLKDNK